MYYQPPKQKLIFRNDLNQSPSQVYVSNKLSPPLTRKLDYKTFDSPRLYIESQPAKTQRSKAVNSDEHFAKLYKTLKEENQQLKDQLNILDMKILETQKKLELLKL